MGNARSDLSENSRPDSWWSTPTMDTEQSQQRDDLNEFKQELERKHEKRRQLIAEKRKEMMDLREELEKCKKENEELKKMRDSGSENEALRLQVEQLQLDLRDRDELVDKNREMRISIAEMQNELQSLNTEFLAIEQERLEYSNHISALKDVVRVTKDMLGIRETQIEDLHRKVKTVEELLASKEMKFMSDGLREEYEKQLRNIRNLRVLYEERQRLDKVDKEHLQAQLEQSQKQTEEEQKKNSELLERIAELEKDNSEKYDSITSLQSNLGLTKAECKELQAEINIINQLFSEILLGFNNSQEVDLDKLVKLLEENHDLLTNMVTNEESDSTAAALPKLLLDLINQTNKEELITTKDYTTDHQACSSHQLNSVTEIVANLPKVWKVLIELLSHQSPPSNDISDDKADPCYKSVETPTGPKQKLSVSQTFIRLKDLIMEKKFLERESYRLKHLNSHLETRLQDQETRLGLVSGELKKTWHVVGKMQRQHQQLHTHEKVLRYELQQKRKLLVELKEELQYCREKWVLAREKNDTTQEQWKELRKEFAARKTVAVDDFSQSAESGYSDDKDSSEDERGYESDVEEGKDNAVAKDLNDMKTESVQSSEERQNGNQDDINNIHVNCDVPTTSRLMACGSGLSQSIASPLLEVDSVLPVATTGDNNLPSEVIISGLVDEKVVSETTFQSVENSSKQTTAGIVQDNSISELLKDNNVLSQPVTSQSVDNNCLISQATELDVVENNSISVILESVTLQSVADNTVSTETNSLRSVGDNSVLPDQVTSKSVEVNSMLTDATSLRLVENIGICVLPDPVISQILPDSVTLQVLPDPITSESVENARMISEASLVEYNSISILSESVTAQSVENNIVPTSLQLVEDNSVSVLPDPVTSKSIENNSMLTEVTSSRVVEDKSISVLSESVTSQSVEDKNLLSETTSTSFVDDSIHVLSGSVTSKSIEDINLLSEEASTTLVEDTSVVLETTNSQLSELSSSLSKLTVTGTTEETNDLSKSTTWQTVKENCSEQYISRPDEDLVSTTCQSVKENCSEQYISRPDEDFVSTSSRLEEDSKTLSNPTKVEDNSALSKLIISRLVEENCILAERTAIQDNRLLSESTTGLIDEDSRVTELASSASVEDNSLTTLGTVKRSNILSDSPLLQEICVLTEQTTSQLDNNDLTTEDSSISTRGLTDESIQESVDPYVANEPTTESQHLGNNVANDLMECNQAIEASENEVECNLLYTNLERRAVKSTTNEDYEREGKGVLCVIKSSDQGDGKVQNKKGDSAETKSSNELIDKNVFSAIEINRMFSELQVIEEQISRCQSESNNKCSSEVDNIDSTNSKSPINCTEEYSTPLTCVHSCSTISISSNTTTLKLASEPTSNIPEDSVCNDLSSTKLKLTSGTSSDIAEDSVSVSSSELGLNLASVDSSNIIEDSVQTVSSMSKTESNKVQISSEKPVDVVEAGFSYVQKVSTGAIPKQMNTDNTKMRNTEAMLSAREARLQRLERECKALVSKVTNTSQKSVTISNKLDDLHGIYGPSPVNSDNQADKDEDDVVSKDTTKES